MWVFMNNAVEYDMRMRRERIRQYSCMELVDVVGACESAAEVVHNSLTMHSYSANSSVPGRLRSA